MERDNGFNLNKLYEQLINGLAIHIYWKDSSFKYIYCNQLQAENLGFKTPNDIIGRSDYDLLSKEEADILRKNDTQIILSRKPCIFEESSSTIKGKLVFLTQKIPMIINDKVVGIAGISLDITARKKEEEKMLLKQKNSERTLYEILDNLPGHVYWKDKNGVFLGCNRAQVISAGFTKKSEIIGKTDYDFPWQADVETIRESDRLVMETNESISREEKAQVIGDDQESVFLSKKSPLYDSNNQIIGVIGISFDITDRKKMENDLRVAKEKADAANFIMTEFISNMGHDLAAPISDVGGIAQILNLYSDEYPELKELIDTLISRAAASEAVRKTIINATSISNLEVNPEKFSIIQELLNIETFFKSAITSKNLRFVINPLKPKKEDMIKTDRSKFHDILMALIDNSIKFTDEGQITISVFKEGDRFKISIADTGIGIPADKFGYIFEQYTKLSRSNKYGVIFKGVGAGLYLARILANLLGATISVESEVGKGSIFTITISNHP